MSDPPRQTLRDIVAQRGDSVIEHPQLCRGLLLDLCGEQRREINLLVTAQQEGVAEDLRGLRRGVPIEPAVARLTKRLVDRHAMAEGAARWAVESWALAVGISLPAPQRSPPQPKPQTRATPLGSPARETSTFSSRF